MPRPQLRPSDIEEGIRSLYRDPVDRAQASLEVCLSFRDLHYPPLALLLRATNMLGLPPPHDADEASATALLRSLDFEIDPCTVNEGGCCGGVAGLEPRASDMAGFGRPYEP